MLYNTEAVVIRTMKYGEAHAILTLLTPQGTLAAMARGAKKPQSKLASSTRLGVQGVYAVYQNTGMGTISQAEVQVSRRLLHERLDLAAYAAYFCELVSTVAEPRPNGSSATYTLFTGALDRLLMSPDECAVTARIWEAKVLHMLGASPRWTSCAVCGQWLETSCAYSPVEGGLLCSACAALRQTSYIAVPPSLHRVLDGFVRVPWHRLGTIRLSHQTKRALKTVLQIQLETFAGIDLKSRTVLESLDLES